MRPPDRSGTSGSRTPPPADEAMVVAKAVSLLAERFGINNSQLARILGLSEATISLCATGTTSSTARVSRSS